MITIAVDAMGGDVGLNVTVPASVAFLERQNDVQLFMVGDETQLQAALSSVNAPMNRITIVHTSQVVGMDEDPRSALRHKKDSSMRVAIAQVKEGLAQAAVSAGNTGALMATAKFVLKTIDGIERPAIAKFLPTSDGGVTCVLDLGANIDSSPAHLLQFAIMGSQLVQAVNANITAPRVGLLNIGSEEIKGTSTVKEAFQLLQQSQLNFIGNVEGDDIFSGEVDVIVADGFVGNVALKTIEGTVKMMGQIIKHEFNNSVLTKAQGLIAKPVLAQVKKRIDPRRFNGAIFLGLRGVVVKSHGGTDAVGFNYALQEAYHEARADISTSIQRGVEAHLLAEQQSEQASGAI